MLIQAYRNDFKHIKIYGIENDQHTIPYTKAILSKLSPNIIIEYGDITSPYVYRNLDIDNINFITNETIPRE
jgi:hypothetical protein